MDTTTNAPVVKFTHAGAEHEGTLKAKKGLFWEVETEPGIVKNIPVKAILNRAELELPKPDENRPGPAVPAPQCGLEGQLNGLSKNLEEGKKPKKDKKEKAAKDPNVVTLKELCEESGIIGRIARRRLRKAFGTIEAGARWEWKKSDPKLVEIRALLTAKEDPAAEEEDADQAAEKALAPDGETPEGTGTSDQNP